MWCVQIWQRTDLNTGSNKFRMVYESTAGRISWRSNMLRLAYADSGSACKLAQDMVPTAHTEIDVRAQPLESSLGRVPQAADGTCKKIFVIRIVSVAEDCLSPERTFHGCLLMHFRGCFRCSIPRLFPSRYSLRAQPLESSLGRVPQAADASCNKIFASWIVSVAEDCLSPERTFHGCSHMHFRGCIRCCFRGAKLLL